MMASGFLRGRRGRILGVFSPLEAELLRSLVSQVIELVRDESPEARSGDPLESLLDFDGPTRTATTPTRRRSSAGSPSVDCATRRPSTAGR
jgi:hypothetical protein